MKSLTDNKRTAISLLIITIFLFTGCTEKNEEKSVTLIKMGGATMMTSMAAGTIDAMICWEPWNSLVFSEGIGEYLVNSSEIWPHHPCCILAADYNWYEKVGEEKGDDILKRVALAHLRANEWIDEALPKDSENHSKLLTYAKELTGKNESVIELANRNIDFDYDLDLTGIKTYADKLMEYGLFESSKWEASGYVSTDAYINSIVERKYIGWAKEHEADTNLSLPEEISLRIGYLSADLHHLTLFVAKEEGFFSDCNISVTLHDPFVNGAAEMQDGFKQDTIDIGYLGIAPAMIQGINANDFGKNDARINVIASVNYDGTAIMVRKGIGINSVKDLAGKRLAYPGPGTVQHFLALTACEKSGIKAL